MADQFDRTRSLIGSQRLEIIRKASVLVFGVGGVGGYSVEALARAGVGRIDLVDKDCIDITNINRQIIATHDSVGRVKVDVMRERLLSINPEIKCDTFQVFWPDENTKIDFEKYDYIVDCVDNVSAKVDIIEKSKAAGVPVISSMGTGNKLDPTKFEIADIEKTSVCPLARAVRKCLREKAIKDVKVLFSKEEPFREDGLPMPASISFVPSCAGLIIAGEVIKDIMTGGKRDEKNV